jgi:homoserine kinase
MSATAFAPATVGNAAVGFDILGFALEGVGDRVTVERTAGPTVSIESVSGVAGCGTIPLDPARNTATVGLLEMVRELRLRSGFRVRIEKGIPLGSGMGGSAASAVGGVVAANALLEERLPDDQLLRYALLGEQAASGSAHADNAAPCLYGGLVLDLGSGGVVRLPVPPGIRCVLVHPHLKLETREMRGVLRPEVPLEAFVRQGALLAGFISGCYEGDLARIGRCLADVVIEPQRERFIPGFLDAKRAALEAGALGFSISGSGPSVFAWAAGEEPARDIQTAIRRELRRHRVESDAWISPIRATGAQVVSP